MGQKYLGRWYFSLSKHLLNIDCVLLLTLVGIPTPLLAFALEVSIGGKRAAESRDGESHLQHKLSFVDVDDAFVGMLLAFERVKGIMIAGNPQDLALQYLLQPIEAIVGFLSLLLLVMGVILVVAVGDVSAHDAVVEVGSFDAFGQAL